MLTLRAGCESLMVKRNAARRARQMEDVMVDRRPGNVGVVVMGRDKCLLLLHVIRQAKKWVSVQEQLAANEKIGLSGATKLAWLSHLDVKWFDNLKAYVEECDEHAPFVLDKLLLEWHVFRCNLGFGPNDRVREHLLSDQTACFNHVIEVALMILRGEIVKAADTQHGFVITHKAPLPAAPAATSVEEDSAAAAP